MCPYSLFDVWNKIRSGNLEKQEYLSGFDILQSNPQLFLNVLKSIEGLSVNKDHLLNVIANQAYAMHRRERGYIVSA
jgi:hypothetical protein